MDNKKALKHYKNLLKKFTLILPLSLIYACGGESLEESLIPEAEPYEIIVQGGGDVVVQAGSTIYLNGSSAEAETFLWSVNSGHSITLESAYQKNSSFIAPYYDEPTTVELLLTAKNSRAGVGTDLVSVTINPNLVSIGFPTDNSILNTGSSDVSGRVNLSQFESTANLQVTVFTDGQLLVAELDAEGFWRASDLTLSRDNEHTVIKVELRQNNEVLEQRSITVQTVAFYRIYDLAYDVHNNNAYVLTRDNIQEIDLATNTRRLITTLSDVRNVTDALNGAAGYKLSEIVYDSISERLLAIAGPRLVSINIQTGEVTIISSYRDAIGDGVTNGNMKHLFLDKRFNRVLVSNENKFLRINLATGNRSYDVPLNGTGHCSGPSTIDEQANVLYFVDSCTHRVIRYDREVIDATHLFEENSFDDEQLRYISEIRFDASQNRILMIGQDFNIIATDMATLEPIDIELDLAYSESQEAGLVIANDGNYITSFYRDALVKINPDTFNTIELVTDKSGSGDFMNELRGMGFDNDTHQLIVMNDTGLNSPRNLLSVDSFNGTRKLIPRETGTDYSEDAPYFSYFQTFSNAKSFFIGGGSLYFLRGERNSKAKVLTKEYYMRDESRIKNLRNVLLDPSKNILVFSDAIPDEDPDAVSDIDRLYQRQLPDGDPILISSKPNYQYTDLFLCEETGTVYTLGYQKDPDDIYSETTVIGRLDLATAKEEIVFSSIIDGVRPNEFVLACNRNTAYIYSNYFTSSIIELNLGSGESRLISGELSLPIRKKGDGPVIYADTMILDEGYQRLFVHNRFPTELLLIDLKTGHRATLTKSQFKDRY